MRTYAALILTAVLVYQLAEGSTLLQRLERDLVRHPRQVWSFPDNPSTGFRPPTTTRPRTTTTRRTTTTGRTTTSRSPDSSGTTVAGVIFQLQNCDCPAPPQYNPVCGTDGNTYVNRQKLMCASRCGNNVQFARMGLCNM